MNEDYTNEREPLNTKSMIEEAFFKNLGKSSKTTPKAESSIVAKESSVKYNTEDLLLKLFDARDGLVETYSKIGLGAYSQSFVDSINKIGTCIRSLGGEAENFDPFAHMSGLKSPSLQKNAKRVIENTVEAYTLGKIDDAKIADDGKGITITFTGRQGNTNYKAVGNIEPFKAWVGNEAADYIYSPNEGRMSVKIFADNKWIDKSSEYKISWELFESEANFDVMSVEGENNQPKKETNKVELKEEIKNDTLNNIDNDIGDFEVEEK